MVRTKSIQNSLSAHIATRDFSAITRAFVPVFLGFSLLFVAGISNAQTIHDAAHDARHAFGWVCH